MKALYQETSYEEMMQLKAKLRGFCTAFNEALKIAKAKNLGYQKDILKIIESLALLNVRTNSDIEVRSGLQKASDFISELGCAGLAKDEYDFDWRDESILYMVLRVHSSPSA
jgi:hypothetical protein